MSVICYLCRRMEETDFTTERYVAEFDAGTYIKDFRKEEYFLGFCRQCGNYGSRYGCPPFNYDPLTKIGKYRNVRIVGVKIIPAEKDLPMSAARSLLKPVVLALNEEMLGVEAETGGYYCGFAGSCEYCGGEQCARKANLPCRHPDKVRPSLEAFGFDIGKTASDLLGIELKWSKGDKLPEYLTLVCGLFY